MDNPSHEPGLASRRNFMGAVAAAAGGLAAVGGGLASPPAQAQQASAGAKKGKAVALNWKEVYFTNCPMVSANNIDQELGWCKTDFKAIGIDYSYFRSRRETDWYPHYIHNQDNLIRFGGLYPPIHVQADIRRTRLLGATWVHEGGCMAVRAGDPIWRMKDLKGKKIGLSKSLNTIKNDWWRIQEHMGIESMLMLNDMTMKDVQIVEFPYPDDWYDDPKMLEPLINPTDLWATRDHKRDLAFRPLETALLSGKVDAIYTQSKVFQHLQEDTGQIRMIEDLSRRADWKLQVANTPAVITCTDVMAREHPELVVTYMKAMIKVGRWANQYKQAAAVLLDRQTFYRDAEDTYQGIKDVDMVPNLSPQNLACVTTGKDFMLKNGYIKNDFDVQKWAAPEFLEMAAKQLIEEQWKKKSGEKLPEGTQLRLG
ncbi:MAG: ABC transporter substrate-binding protein [Betaproteobacteria bacterium]|nr:ABC transporter substrate-binding protein [Betaproteobacteria bacterium]MBK7459353.1 ABC transporter substrate-binding protein [Betaproteobacteria bacterium]MBK8108064.1 ABC transporter substrate-binding protein [Betaproteobacteria bacterium]MBP6542452.1 ABC transporter substrate-binding protein [Piscinibacter sp.]